MPTLRGAGTKGGSADAGDSMVADGEVHPDGQEPNTKKPLHVPFLGPNWVPVCESPLCSRV